MTDRELMQMALDALECSKEAIEEWGSYASPYFQAKHNLEGDIDDCQAVIEALRARLAQPDCACDSPTWCKQYGKCHRVVVGVEPARPETKPVAYTNGTYVILAKYWTADYPSENWEPLYTAPLQSKPKPEPTKSATDPVAWQWLNTGTFRKKLPENAERSAWRPLYATQFRREWQTLKDDEIASLVSLVDTNKTAAVYGLADFARAIEAKLKEKNT